MAVPGTSEHQLGLALDIVDRSNQNLDESQEDTAVQQWLRSTSLPTSSTRTTAGISTPMWSASCPIGGSAGRFSRNKMFPRPKQDRGMSRQE